MEPGPLIAIALLVAFLGGGGVLLARNGALPWTTPPRALASSRTQLATTGGDSSAESSRRRGSAESQPAVAAASSPAAPAVARIRSIAPEPSPTGPDTGADLAARLARIEARLDGLARAVELQGAELHRELRQSAAELLARGAAEDARRDAAFERFRADALSAMHNAAGTRQTGEDARRTEVSAELYARLARLEAALAAVTNPVLLPGEPYALPAEFPPESLVWENWNEVGERAFALADALSAQRLFLTDECRAELGTFITSVRTLLTRSVYPHLQPEPSLAQQTALRAALEEIAAAIPRAREALEREFRGEALSEP